MSRGNPKRLSSHMESSVRGSSPKGAVGATSLGGLSGGGREPRGSESWHIDEKLAKGSPAHDLAELAIAAVELREYLAFEYGFTLSMDDAMDYVERNGADEADS